MDAKRRKLLRVDVYIEGKDLPEAKTAAKMVAEVRKKKAAKKF